MNIYEHTQFETRCPRKETDFVQESLYMFEKKTISIIKEVENRLQEFVI